MLFLKTISDTSFNDNMAMHAGAAILLLTDATSTTYVTNCTFDTNAAGAFREEDIRSHLTSFQVRHTIQ